MTANKQDTKEANKAFSSDEFIEKLKRALRRDGDFPASAKVVGELKTLVNKRDTTANNIAELILREPTLGTRVLHLVNSAFYRRAKPIMTVSHAVVQIGMRPLADLCSSLVLLQRFVPAARQGGAFAQCLQKSITTSLLSSSFTTELNRATKNSSDETGYLAGTFFELGTLLLAYYFPQLYQSAVKRSSSKKQSIGKSIHELCGLSPNAISQEVIKALNLPDLYLEILELSENQGVINDSSLTNLKHKDSKIIGDALYAAHNISEVITFNGSKEELEAVVNKLQSRIAITQETFGKVLVNLQNEFKDHCSTLDLTLPSLPEYIESFSPLEEQEELQDEIIEVADDDADHFMHFVEEIRQAVDNREPTAAVITTVMETFAWSLNFDRVMLLLMDSGKQRLIGRMALGEVNDINVQEIKRELEGAGPFAPDAVAIKESRPVFNGDPFFENGWPISVIPIGFGKRAIGVIYADRINSDDDELSSKEQAAIGVLAELLDRSISVNS